MVLRQRWGENPSFGLIFNGYPTGRSCDFSMDGYNVDHHVMYMYNRVSEVMARRAFYTKSGCFQRTNTQQLSGKPILKL